jgi:hypothetical protein
MDVPENILARIKKLLSLSESSNENEAAAAAAKAQELMFKYEVEMSQVANLDLRPNEKVDEHNFDLDAGESKVANWRSWLFGAVAETSMCQPYFHRSSRGYGKRGKVYGRIIGRKSDVEVAQYTYSWLTNELERLSHQYMANQIYWDQYDSRKMRRSWLEGAAIGVSKKLREEFRSRSTESEASTALVVVRDKEIQDWMEDHGLQLQSRKSTVSAQDRKAYAAGFQTGSSLSVRRGVSGGSAAPRIGR